MNSSSNPCLLSRMTETAIVSDYQQLEERHLFCDLEKDQLIQDAATENNKLKEEPKLRSHMDDLNSENAKLNAELIQYREDLEPSVVKAKTVSKSSSLKLSFSRSRS